MVVFLFFLFFVFLTLIYYFIFLFIVIFYYFILFLKNIKIKKSELFYIQSSYNLTDFFIFLKLVYWEGLFIYSFYFFYNFLKNYKKKDKKLFKQILIFFKNKELIKTFVIIRLFRYVFFIPYKTFSIALDLTERLFIFIDWDFKYSIIPGYFYLEISNVYFITLKSDILEKKIFVSNNEVLFNPLKQIAEDISIKARAMISDPFNIKLGMLKTKTEGNYRLHLSKVISLRNDKAIFISETTKDTVRVFNESTDKWEDIETVSAGRGSLKDIGKVFVTHPVSAVKSELNFVELGYGKYKDMVTCKIVESNFILPLVVSLNQPHFELINGKMVISINYKDLESYVIKNFEYFPEKTKFFLESTFEFKAKFSESLKDLSLEDEIAIYKILISGNLSDNDDIIIEDIFTKYNNN